MTLQTPIPCEAPAGAEQGPATDVEVAQRIAGGDRDALRRLMRRCNQRLYRTARAILRDDAEAEDAVQEGYLLAYRAMATFRGGSTLSTWLVRIVANEALGRLRKRARQAEIVALCGSTEPIDSDPEAAMGDALFAQPEDAAARAELRRLIETRIDELPDAFRIVFVLRALEELSPEETAECLGIPSATVRTRFFRARGMLRESLARDLDLTLDDAFRFDGDRCDRIVAAVMRRVDEPAPGSC